MEKWAKAWPDMHFLCLCTAGNDEHELSGNGGHNSANHLASKMAEQSGLKNCVNAVVDAPELLTHPFSQLGCSGFIVLDSEHHVVCAKTSSYLNLKKWAFLHVDTILDAQKKGAPVPRVCPGEMVTLQGGEHNGSRALCIKMKNGGSQIQVAVQPSGKCVWLSAQSALKDGEKQETVENSECGS